jgi:glycogen(starch) synthase
MKILIYTQAFAPQVGGQETIVMLLARGLASVPIAETEGPIEITVVTPTSANGMDDSALPFRVVRRPRFLEICRLFRETDIIHLAGSMIVPMILGRLLRKPVVIEHHGFQPICPNGQLLYQPTQSLCPGHFMAGRFDKCIKCNAERGKLSAVEMWFQTFPRRWLSQRVAVNVLPTKWLGSLLNLNRMETIVHGLPPSDVVQVVSARPATPTFVFVGRLVSTKGVRVLLEATEQLKAKSLAFDVKIVGQGPDRQSLENLACQLNIQEFVEFLGYVPPDPLAAILSGAAAIVMPSIAGEVFGLSAAENMLNGKLVIASNLGSLAEVVGNAGMTFPAGNSAALSDLMAAVIEDPTRAEGIGLAAQKRIVGNFSLDRMVVEHVALYRRVLSRGGNRNDYIKCRRVDGDRDLDLESPDGLKQPSSIRALRKQRKRSR